MRVLDGQGRVAVADVFAREARRRGRPAVSAGVLEALARDVLDGQGRVGVVEVLAAAQADIEVLFLLADFLDCGLASPAALAAWVAGREEVAGEGAVAVHSQDERVVPEC
ncbi:MAG: hypothetical protein SFW67_05720 [Myxococcaceae bacterium]|nr:hypothetical protein [Myxococcaceae bacterium]